MKISHIATAAAVPAVIAGAAISFGVAGHAAAGHPAPGKTQHTAAPDSKALASTGSAGTGHANSGQQAGAAQATSSSPGSVWVIVRRGQTLSGIASAHHMSWQAIYATWPNMRVLHNPDALVTGERLRIPSDPKLRAAQFKARYAARLGRGTAASPAPAAAQAPATSAGGTFSSAGMSSFEQCVALRESSDTPTDPDGLFGILPSTWQSLGYSGSAGEASVAVQEQAFAKLYAEDGTAPWAPYDGC